MTAMLLPEKEKQPRIVHVQAVAHYEKDVNDNDEEYVEPILTAALGTNMCEKIDSHLLPSEVMAHLTHPIRLFGRSGFLTDGSAPNACVAYLSEAMPRGQSLDAGSWRGPLVGFKIQPRAEDPNYLDLEMRDVHDVFELVRQYARLSQHCG